MFYSIAMARVLLAGAGVFALVPLLTLILLLRGTLYEIPLAFWVAWLLISLFWLLDAARVARTLLGEMHFAKARQYDRWGKWLGVANVVSSIAALIVFLVRRG